MKRIMVLNLLNLYSLIFALFDKINGMTTELENFRINRSDTNRMTSAVAMNISTTINPQAYSAVVQCCRNSSTETDIGTPASLIAAIAIPLVQKVLRNANTESTEDITDYTLTPTEFTENYTNILTTTEKDFENNTTYNYINTSNFEEFQYAFVDYLTLMLFGASQNQTFDESLNSLNLTDNSNISYDSFKTTMAPLLNTSTTELDEKYGDEFTKVFDELKTTFFEDSRITIDCKMICTIGTTSRVVSTIPTIIDELGFNYTVRRRLRSLCWETMFGQELIKLTVLDLIMTILSTLALDLVRGIFVRVMNRCWCWDLEKKFPQYGDFKVAENILHLVNNQGMVWMGMFFSPGLIVLNVVKLFVLMYFRAWIVLTCNVPHEIIFRASRSNNFYYALLLMMLFLCVLPVGYAIVWIKPSWNCGPFTEYQKIFHIFTKTIKKNVPKPVEKALDYIASPGIVIPLLLLLTLIIYYLISLTNALREANNDLKIQLRRERTEERRKMFQIADKRRRRSSGGSGEFSNTPFAKWKKLLGTMPNNGKSFDDTTPRQDSNDFPQIKEERAEPNKNKDFFSKFIKKALGKSSISEDENQEAQNLDEGTDTEQHESLPEDLVSIKDTTKPPLVSKLSTGSGSFDYPRVLLQKKNSQKSSSDSSEKHFQIKDHKAADHKKEVRQDSGSSVWSDNIPVITISKTESAEGLDVVPEMAKIRAVGEAPPKTESESRFKPKIKCALKKQSTEIDEDLICYFNKDLELKPELSHPDEKENFPGVSINSESSDDTARESSTGTVLNSSNIMLAKEEELEDTKEGENGTCQTSNGSITESSAEYNDITSL
ncbi:transmembrane channel-like protein 3 [Asbolus verrucosus]|uniref:Transmembrane channel-like protein 3 n=1 Tax=Asbolus verrucosus TaxID=1661398 RepID=A0A482VU33_ASBVE|nr:transmembrane channel-like protein 3 [Asbolus verrucosus]